MNNSDILKSLENQRDQLFEKLKTTSVSATYQQEYDQIVSGQVFVMGDNKEQMLQDLKVFAKDTSLDEVYSNKLKEYQSLDNATLITYFQTEIERVLDNILASGKLDEIQGIFIEYDHYYHYTSYIICYGKQDFPVMDEPRYIFDELDHSKQILMIEDGINFQPAWVDCYEFEHLDYISIDLELENLFQLHSRTLLHIAIDQLRKNNKLDILSNKPFVFYINEHDCEVMILYRLG